MVENNEQKQQVVDSLKQANNILVTVKRDPSIDQLAACIALTLILDNQGKHGTAVFSGEVPSVLEFLEPGKTLEKNTDSLQDFIISLDKSKADKLRYKVEDSVVRIFITPYKTSISDKDLEFGQGDFNVDVVVALGVHNQDDLDEAITSHGRILHDATVISMNTDPGESEDLGSINWIDTDASSLSEMVAGMADSLARSAKKSKPDDGDEDEDAADDGGQKRAYVIDNQIATALLTGIVAETERFGNAKTTPATMEMAAKLLTAGANQELVASKLAEPPKAKAQEFLHDTLDNTQSQDSNTNDGRNDHDEPDVGLMPALSSSADDEPIGQANTAKSIYEADEDESNPDSVAITHPDETDVAALDDGSAQTIDHQNDPGTQPEDDLALAHAGTGFDMPQLSDTTSHSHGIVITPPTRYQESGDDSQDAPFMRTEMEQPSKSSYGLAPPIMGGTLTSNSTEDPSSHGQPEPTAEPPATLTHTRPDFERLTPPLNQTANHASGPPQEVTPAAALIPQSKLISPLTVAPAALPTLADLEKNINSPHAGALDMPQPVLTPLLQPSAAPSLDPRQLSQPMMTPTSPLPPTPPPLTPPIGS